MGQQNNGCQLCLIRYTVPSSRRTGSTSSRSASRLYGVQGLNACLFTATESSLQKRPRRSPRTQHVPRTATCNGTCRRWRVKRYAQTPQQVLTSVNSRAHTGRQHQLWTAVPELAIHPAAAAAHGAHSAHVEDKAPTGVPACASQPAYISPARKPAQAPKNDRLRSGLVPSLVHNTCQSNSRRCKWVIDR
jgi:hypothetical protein